MELQQYLREHNVKPSDFAQEIGVRRGAIWRYGQGRIPSPEIMVRIYYATNGAVTPNDFYDLGPTPGLSDDDTAEPALRQEQGAEQ